MEHLRRGLNHEVEDVAQPPAPAHRVVVPQREEVEVPKGGRQKKLYFLGYMSPIRGPPKKITFFSDKI